MRKSCKKTHTATSYRSSRALPKFVTWLNLMTCAKKKKNIVSKLFGSDPDHPACEDKTPSKYCQRIAENELPQSLSPCRFSFWSTRSHSARLLLGHIHAQICAAMTACAFQGLRVSGARPRTGSILPQIDHLPTVPGGGLRTAVWASVPPDGEFPERTLRAHTTTSSKTCANGTYTFALSFLDVEACVEAT